MEQMQAEKDRRKAREKAKLIEYSAAFERATQVLRRSQKHLSEMNLRFLSAAQLSGRCWESVVMEMNAFGFSSSLLMVIVIVVLMILSPYCMSHNQKRYTR